jgi:hypothetical protein
LKFLDQDTVFDNPGIYTDDDGDGSYDDLAELADNTICIDISDPTFTGTKVQGNMDSAGDVYTFIPSNPQIAHIISQQDYEFATCKNANCGEILLGERIGSVPQGPAGSETCMPFDNESGEGYCTGGLVNHTNNNMIIYRADDNFVDDAYNITLTILVNGTTGDHGVYFSNDPVYYAAYDNEDDACDYEDETGTALNAAAGVDPAGYPECDVPLGSRPTTLTTTATNLFTGNEDYLVVDIPTLVYDLDEVADGDQVEVEVTLTKAPCGELFTDTWCIGEIVNACTVVDPAGPSDELLYPYFTNMTGDSWWDGIVVDNLSATAGGFTAYIFEKDGDQGTYSPAADVAGYSSYIALLSNIVGDANITVSTGSGVLGDSPCYIIVCTEFISDGFAMLGSTLDSAVNGSETMGYLPRQNTNMCSGM